MKNKINFLIVSSLLFSSFHMHPSAKGCKEGQVKIMIGWATYIRDFDVTAAAIADHRVDEKKLEAFLQRDLPSMKHAAIIF